MEKRNIGKSGLSAPFLGLGTWAIGGGRWWGDNDDALSVKAIETAVEQGIVWIDTAPIYGLYHSEEVVGEALRHIDRDKVILSTKCGLEWRHESPVLHKVVDGVQTYRDLSAKSIIEDVEDSLRRLGTDHLDVLYTHWQTPDPSIFPLEETVEAMMKLKEQGKIRAIGASNTTADLIRGYCKYGQLDVIQEKYSLLTRRIEKQLLPTCKELGVSIQAYSPLEQGLLTGKVTMDTTYPEGSTRNTNPCFQPARRVQAIRLLEAIHAELQDAPAAVAADAPRILLTGVPTGMGSHKVVQLLEECGASVVCIDNCTCYKKVLLDMAEEGDALDVLARRYLDMHCAVMSPNPHRYSVLRDLARDFAVDAVVDLTWQGCQPYDVESWSVKKFVREELGLPFLQVVTDYSGADTEQLKVRLEAFLEMLS